MNQSLNKRETAISEFASRLQFMGGIDQTISIELAEFYITHKLARYHQDENKVKPLNKGFLNRSVMLKVIRKMRKAKRGSVGK